MELITTLGINWQMLVAQLINFGLLIGILSFLLYRPILRLLDDRRERIKKAMEDAKSIENQRREIDEFKSKQMREIDAQVGKFLEDAKKQADAAKKEILGNAEREATQLLAKAKQQMADDRARMLGEAQSALASVVVRMTEKILEREFSKDDQKRILGSVEKELPSLLR